MADRTVKIVIDAQVSGLQGKLKAASASASEFGTKLSKGISQNAGAIDGLSNKMGLLGAGMVGAAGIAVKKFADFDQAMSGVAATSESARASIDKLRAAALDAGSRTVFSATEAAGAIEELSKAGLETADILGGALDGALDLAAAGSLDLAEAAGYTSVALQQFGLDGDQAAHVADLLAAGAGKAMGEVSDFGQALKQGGLVAAQTGLSIEETTGALASFAQAGLLGSDAGTSLKTMLQRLTPQSDEAKATFDRLGISAYDAQGNFVGLADFAGQLQTKMADLTPEARNAAMSVMFGSDAVRAASVLYDEGAQGIQGWITAVDDQGYAAEVAATRLDNLKGDLEGLSGAFETALIGMGEGANGPLRSLVQSATDSVNAFSDLPAGIQGATLALVGGGGLVALGVAGLGKLAIATTETIAAMKTLGIVSDTTAGRMAKGMGRAAKAAGIAAAAVATMFAAYQSRPDDAGKGVNEMAADLGRVADGAAVVDSIFSKIDTENGAWGWFSGDNGTGDFATFLDQAARSDAWTKIESGIAGVTEGIASWVGADIRTEWTKQYDTLVAFGDELGKMAATDLPSAAAAFQELFKQAGGTSEDGEQLLKLMPGLRDALIGVADSSGLATDDATLLSIALGEVGPLASDATVAVDENASAIDRLAAAQSTGTATIETYNDALKELVEQQREAAGGVLDLRDAERNYYAALDEGLAAIEDNGRTLDRTTEAGRANQAALDDLAESGWDVITSMQEQGATQEDLQSQMSRTRDDFITLAEKMGMSERKAEDLADELGLIPENVDVKVAVDTADATNDINTWITANDGRRVRVTMDLRYPGGQVYHTPGRDMFASGGSVSGPGTGTSDDVPAMLSNGEHVLTASDVQKAGGQGAIYRMRAAIQGGLLRFAAGGAVGDARREVAAADRARQAAWKKVSTGGWKDADVEAWEKAREKWMEAVERLDRLMGQAQEAIVDARRGDTMRSATSSLSGAYGLVDQLRDLANDEDLSRGQRDSFARRAKEAEVAFKRLYGQADRIESKLGKARDRVQELSSIKASASSALQGGFGIGGMFGQKDAYGYDKPVTGKSILAGAKEYANKLKRFGGKLSAVRKKLGPGSGVILQELVGLGVEEGTVAADAILSLNDGEANELTRAYQDIKKYSDLAGQTVTEGFYKGGLSAAEGVVDGLEKEADAIARQIENIARRETNAIRRALGLPPLSPSAKRGAPRSEHLGGGQISMSSAPRAMSPVASSSSGSKGNAIVAQVTAEDAALIGAALAEAWRVNPPRAIYAPGSREVGRLYQDGQKAAVGLR